MWAGSLDLILDTISCEHHIQPYEKLLARDGKLVLLGMSPPSLLGLGTLGSRAQQAVLCGVARAQEAMNFCARARICPAVEVCSVWELNRVYERLAGGNAAGLRHVLDLAGTLNQAAFTQCVASPPLLAPPGPPEPRTRSFQGGSCGA